MDDIEQHLGLRPLAPGERSTLPRLGIADAFDAGRPIDGPFSRLRHGRWQSREIICFPVAVDTGSRQRPIAFRDVVLIRFPERRCPAFAAEWNMGMGTAGRRLRRVTPAPAGTGPGWRLFSANGQWPFDPAVSEWLGSGRGLDARGNGLCFQGGDEWLAIDRTRPDGAPSTTDDYRQWLEVADQEACALAAQLADVPYHAARPAAVRSVSASVAGAHPPPPATSGEPPDTPRRWTMPKWLGIVLLVVLMSVFLGFGAWFDDTVADLSPLPRSLSWILLLAYLLQLMIRLDRRERRLERSRNAPGDEVFAILAPYFELTWKTVLVGSILVAIGSFLDGIDL